MGIYRAKDFIDAYKARATLSDPNALSGRDGRPDITLHVAKKNYEALQVTLDDVLVDVGCGDGTLLKLDLEARGNKKSKGILPTLEEVNRVNSLLKFPLISQGTTIKTNLDSNYADKCVCNGVFLLLANSDEARLSLMELARITKNGGVVLIGELPHLDEYKASQPTDNVPRDLTVLKRVLRVLRQYGVREVWKRLVSRFTSTFSKRLIVVAPPTVYWSSPDDFKLLAESANLNLLKFSPSPSLNANGGHVESSTRYDYLFQRV